MNGRISINVNGQFTTDEHMENIAGRIAQAVKQILGDGFAEGAVTLPSMIVNTSKNDSQ